LLELASTDWIVVGGDVQLYELVGEFRRSATEIALLCRDGKALTRAEDVLAIVSVEDVLADTGLPDRLLRGQNE
jgi:CIC family chloride channel protein